MFYLPYIITGLDECPALCPPYAHSKCNWTGSASWAPRTLCKVWLWNQDKEVTQTPSSLCSSYSPTTVSKCVQLHIRNGHGEPGSSGQGKLWFWATENADINYSLQHWQWNPFHLIYKTNTDRQARSRCRCFKSRQIPRKKTSIKQR